MKWTIRVELTPDGNPPNSYEIGTITRPIAVKHREPLVTRQFQVTAGRVERNGKLGARFVFVSSDPGWTETFFDGFLLQQGMRQGTVMRVVTDGDDGLRYVWGNRRSLPDFAKRRAAGRRISTAHVESVMHHLVNHRLIKKQQMGWSPAGAHYLLQVRAELLNGTLLDGYRVANPRFRGPPGFSYAA